MKKIYKSGFTLIELIIVIAIIAILAVGLLAALNPVEQVNRGRDSALQVAAKALYDAESRFYAQQGYYPWCPSATAVNCTDVSAGVLVTSSSWIGAGTLLAPAAGSPEYRMESVAGTGELKTGFLAGINGLTSTAGALGSMVMSGAGGVNGPGSAPVVCYAPYSLAAQQTATFNNVGGAWASGTKYICLK